MEAMTDMRNSLSDPDYAAFAWRRYRQIMGWMVLAALVAIGLVLLYLHQQIGALPLAMVIGTIAGVGLTVLLGAALMGLAFLSSGTGHDEDVAEFNEDRM